MNDQVVFKIMDGMGCLTSHKKTMRPGTEIRVVDKCHNHYSDVVEGVLKERKENLYKQLSEIYDNDDNYGKEVSINIEYSVSLNPGQNQ